MKRFEVPNKGTDLILVKSQVIFVRNELKSNPFTVIQELREVEKFRLSAKVVQLEQEQKAKKGRV